MSLIQMSVSAGIMIIAIVIIRALTINHLPKKTFLSLWALALLRLMVPFSLPSPFSLYSFLKHSPPSTHITEISAAGFLPFTVPQGSGNSPVNIPVSIQAQTFIPPLSIVWLAGVILFILFFAVSFIRYLRRFSVSLPVSNCFADGWLREHRIKRQIIIQQSEHTDSPLTYGIRHPVILMPKHTDWTDLCKLQYILQHEYVHIRRFDVVTKFLLTAALCIHWFNPLVWVMYVLSNRDLELSCDETVIRFFGETVKSDYALTLIHMEEWKSGFIPFINNFSKNSIEERITAIMKTKKTTLAGLLAAILLVTGTAVFLSTSASPDSGPVTVPDSSPANPLDTSREPAQYLNENGTVDVHTVRKVIDNGDGSINPFGSLTGIEAYDRQEFGQRDLNIYYPSSNETTYVKNPVESSAADGDIKTNDYYPSTYVTDAAADKGTGKGITFAELFSRYSDYGIRYEKQEGSGRGNVYYNDQLVGTFIDEKKDGWVFAFQSENGGDITVYTVYDENGTLISIEKRIS